MIQKNVTEMAHDEYIQRTNGLLRKNNSLATDDVVRRGGDIGFIGKLNL